MLTNKIKQLEATKAKVVALEKSIAAQLEKKLAALPGEYGFDSAEEFLSAVRAATGGKRGGKRGRKRGRPGRKAKGKGKRKAKASAKGKQGRRRRAKITDDTRAKVKSMVEGGKTGSQIAATLKISVPTVHNIKKALGLVKARK